MEVAELSMMTATAITVIILLSGGARTYFKRKYDTSEHFKSVDDAINRNQKVKQRLHNVQAK